MGLLHAFPHSDKEATVTTCSECSTDLPEAAPGRTRLTCSGACRVRRHRRLRAEHEADIALLRHQGADLLWRQAEAIVAGDLDALEAVRRDALLLFGTAI